MPDLNQLWKEAKASDGGSELPDGKYHCRINDVECKESKNGNFGISWDFAVLESNRRIFKWSRLRTNENDEFLVDVGWLKKDLETLGLECESFDVLESVLNMAVDKHVLVEIVTKNGGFRHVGILENLTKTTRTNQKPKSSQKQSQHEKTDDDDIPF